MRRPLTGAILGYLLGLAIAVVLQQQGVWPLDQVTVFLIPAVTGVIGMLLLSLGREGSTVTYVISLILLIPALVWGALGLADTNESGVLNGGCMVTADTSVPDVTTVTDTSKQDPFQIDPEGSLTWAAASPFIFMDYDWEMWTDIGGFPVVFDSGHELNEAGSPANGDTISNVADYASSSGVDITNFTGAFKVGGNAAETCDGFGFVVLLADGLTLPSMIAGALAIILLIILIILVFTGRGTEAVVASATVTTADGGMPEGADQIAPDGFEDTSSRPDTEP
jgi:hypothetical protein